MVDGKVEVEAEVVMEKMEVRLEVEDEHLVEGGHGVDMLGVPQGGRLLQTRQVRGPVEGGEEGEDGGDQAGAHQGGGGVFHLGGRVRQGEV